MLKKHLLDQQVEQAGSDETFLLIRLFMLLL